MYKSEENYEDGYLMEDIVYDSLTGLYSFRTFLSQTEKLLNDNPDKNYIMLVWDIERFKVVNEIFGMEKGDEVLKDIAGKFKNDIGDIGICGRVGNDVFACCFPESYFNKDVVVRRMDYVVSKDGMAYKLMIQGGIYYIHDRSISVIKMCDRALLALKSIKGKFFKSLGEYSDTEREEYVQGQRLLSDLERGIENREFFVVVQPVYNVRTDTICSGEVLVRWNHPEFGLLMPGRFVPVFEKNFASARLDCFVWEEACRIIRRMMDEGEKITPLSVNVSRCDFYSIDVAATLKELVKKYDIPENFLRIEITESAYMDNPDRLMETVLQLKESGFTILMDDFGSGYSSLNVLKDLSFDIVKIDKKLIDEVGTSNKAGNVVCSIIKMAKWLGMKVIVEGVEDIEQAAYLRYIECDYIQGYLYSKPIEVDNFLSKTYDEIKAECGMPDDTIEIDNLFQENDVEKRTLINNLIGALALYEYSARGLCLLKINDEYCRLFKTSPRETFGKALSMIPDYAKERVESKCFEARKCQRVENITITHKLSNGKWKWVDVAILYIGDSNGASRFIFKFNDVTREQKRINRSNSRGFFPILCSLFNEIMELNYTEGTVKYLYQDKYSSEAEFGDEVLEQAIRGFVNNKVINKDKAKVAMLLSKEHIDEFFISDEITENFTMEFMDDRYGCRNCSVTIVKREDEPGNQVINVCMKYI